MRKSLLVLLFSIVSVVTLAQKQAPHQKVTVDQLSAILQSANDDTQLAAKLAALDCTERISHSQLEKWAAALPGDKSREALRIVADSAAWNLPAPSEIPQEATPDAAALRQMLVNVVNYANSALHKLPDFVATRETSAFEDQPQYDELQSLGVVSHTAEPLHRVRSFGEQVSYREGREVLVANGKKRDTAVRHGLETAGEFGPFLNTVLADAVKGKITWARWEDGIDGVNAVFHYQVEKSASHYLVQFCCVAEDISESIPTHIYSEKAAFHGDIVFNPTTGAVARMTVESEPAPGELVESAAMMVDYAPTHIGSKTVVLPVRSVSILKAHTEPPPPGMHMAAFKGQPKTFLNEVRFRDYHEFRGEMRMLTEDEARQSGAEPASGAPATHPGTQQTPPPQKNVPPVA